MFVCASISFTCEFVRPHFMHSCLPFMFWRVVSFVFRSMFCPITVYGCEYYFFPSCISDSQPHRVFVLKLTIRMEFFRCQYESNALSVSLMTVDGGANSNEGSVSPTAVADIGSSPHIPRCIGPGSERRRCRDCHGSRLGRNDLRSISGGCHRCIRRRTTVCQYRIDVRSDGSFRSVQNRCVHRRG